MREWRAWAARHLLNLLVMFYRTPCSGGGSSLGHTSALLPPLLTKNGFHMGSGIDKVGPRLQSWLGNRHVPPMPTQFTAIWVHLEHMHMMLGMRDLVELVKWALRVLARRMTRGWSGSKSFIPMPDDDPEEDDDWDNPPASGSRPKAPDGPYGRRPGAGGGDDIPGIRSTSWGRSR